MHKNISWTAGSDISKFADDLQLSKKVIFIVVVTRESKIRWEGNVAHLPDNQRTLRVTEWYPCERKRSLGRSSRRLSAYLEMASHDWRYTAQDRTTWNRCVRGVIASHLNTDGPSDDGEPERLESFWTKTLMKMASTWTEKCGASTVKNFILGISEGALLGLVKILS